MSKHKPKSKNTKKITPEKHVPQQRVPEQEGESDDAERSRRLFRDAVESARNGASAPDAPAGTVRWVREVVETLAVALVLAFLFKTFEAEAFIIPTGSMAPTLMGKHKDLNCPQCGYRFRVSASEEFDEGNDGETSRRLARARRGEKTPPPPSVVAGTCPQCRYTMVLTEDRSRSTRHHSYDGDRILVFKYFYDMVAPQRWSVTVFRYPGGPQTNFIKRLIGLENETVRIRNGDVFIRAEGEDDFKISRKPTKHLLSMLQIVNDNDYVNPKLHEPPLAWPRSWADETDAFGAMSPVDPDMQSCWQVSEDFRSFTSSGDSDTMRWLHYRHIVPSSEDWFHLVQGRRPPQGPRNNPQLITDFCAYNSGIVRNPVRFSESENAEYHLTVRDMEIDGQRRSVVFPRANPSTGGLNWNGDYALECDLHVLQSRGTFAMRLVEGGVPFLCSIALNSGEGVMQIGEDLRSSVEPMRFSTQISKPGTYKLRFANIDEQLRLWIDGREISVSRDGCYDELCEDSSGPLARDRSPTVLDLTPASFGVKNAQVRLEHLKIFRDIYYIAADAGFQGVCDLTQSGFFHYDPVPEAENKNASILSDPGFWTIFGKTRSVEFPLGKDQFFVMGDNSAKSHDARLWRSLSGDGQYVPRDHMIGEAATVYWPHGHLIPGLNRPWFPNFKDMRFIN